MRVPSKDNISSYNHGTAKVIEMTISKEDQKKQIAALQTSWLEIFGLIAVFVCLFIWFLA